MGLQQNWRSVSVSNNVNSSTVCVVNPQCRQLHPRLVWTQTGGHAQTSVTCYDTHLQRWCYGGVGRCDAAAGGAVVFLLNVLGSVSVDILGTSWDQCVSMVQYCFTSTETISSLGRKAQDDHLDFYTAPELWPLWTLEQVIQLDQSTITTAIMI